jgi:hypothetical protein
MAENISQGMNKNMLYIKDSMVWRDWTSCNLEKKEKNL